MVRPYWYPRGRILESGVPEAYLNNKRNDRKISKRDIIRFGLKNNQRMTLQDEIQQYLQRGELTPIQKKLGARRIC